MRTVLLYITKNATIYIGSIEQSVYQIDSIILLLVDDFCVHLRHFHIRMTEQLRGSIEICSKGQHHRGECVPGCVEQNTGSKQMKG